MLVLKTKYSFNVKNTNRKLKKKLEHVIKMKKMYKKW